MNTKARTYIFSLIADGKVDLSLFINDLLDDFPPIIYNLGQKFILKVRKYYKYIESGHCYQYFNNDLIMSVKKTDKYLYVFKIIIPNNRKKLHYENGKENNH